MNILWWIIIVGILYLAIKNYSKIEISFDTYQFIGKKILLPIIVILMIGTLSYFLVDIIDWKEAVLLRPDVTASKKLVFVVLLLYISYKSNRVASTKHAFTEIFSGLVMIVVFVTIISLGQFQLWGSRINQASDVASCATDPVQEKCVLMSGEKKEKEKLVTKAEQKVFSQPVPRLTKPVGSATKVVVPECGKGWAKVGIPSGWTLTPSWNDVAANPEYRSVLTGNWEDTPTGGGDSVRFCTKHKSYIGDTMILSWSK